MPPNRKAFAYAGAGIARSTTFLCTAFVNPFLRKMASLTSPMAHAFGSPNPTLTPG